MRMKSTLLPCCLLFGLPVPCQESRAIETFHFEVTALGGQKMDQARFADSVLLVDLWGTWCQPCREAIPRLADLYGKYKQHGLEILGLAYEQGGSPQEQAEAVRKFAAEHKITWTLALGDEAIKKQVPGFSGYPTLVLFQRGLKHVKTWSGFNEAIEAEIASSVREALAASATDKPAESGASDPEAVEKEAPEKVPAGRIFRPSNADEGFDFEVTDVDGATLKFADCRGKPVLLALTTTWDAEARPVAALLESLHKEHKDLLVVAACNERDKARKNDTIRAFRGQLGVGYRLFASDREFTSKVHRFVVLPTFLLFDGEGKLVQREDGLSKEIEARLRAKARELATR